MNLSRRDFLKGASALALAAGTMGVSGVALAEEGKSCEFAMPIPEGKSCEFAMEQPVVTGNAWTAKFAKGKFDGVEYCSYDPHTEYDDLPEKLPLIVFLHGEDGKGANGTQLSANRGATFYVEENQQKTKGNYAYVLAPQCPGNNWTDEAIVTAVKALIDEFVSKNPIDTDRIYIEGMSMGGTGVWNMLLTYPNFFAAAIPMCGEVPAKWYETEGAFEAIKNTPIWAYHCLDDEIVPETGTSNAVAAYKAAGGNAIKYEAFQVGSLNPPHEVWVRVFNIGTPHNWMFYQNLKRTEYGAKDPFMMFSHKELKYGIYEVHDFGMDKLYVMERGNEALIIDTAMGGYGAADLYAYIRDNILINKDVEMDIFLTHNHGDHILGIPTLMASGKVRKIYIHKDDEAGLISTLEMFGIKGDTLNLVNLEEGDLVPIGDETLEVLFVPGHTPGCICAYYKDYLFTGDAIGSGDLFIFNSTFDQIRPGQDHFVADVVSREGTYEILTGHNENLYPFDVEYAKHMVALVRGVVQGQIETGTYTRKPGGNAIYKDAQIYFTGKKLSWEE